MPTNSDCHFFGQGLAVSEALRVSLTGFSAGMHSDSLSAVVLVHMERITSPDINRPPTTSLRAAIVRFSIADILPG